MNDLENFIAKCEANGKSYDEINLEDAPELNDADLKNESRKQQLEILEFKGSHIWDGNLEDMRSL